MMTLWDRLVAPASGQKIQLRIHEDNQAAKDIVEAGFSTKLCHISRTHGVHLTSIKDEIDKPECSLLKIGTAHQAADIFTKGVEPQKWEPALDMLGIRRAPLPRKPQAACRTPEPGVKPASAKQPGLDGDACGKDAVGEDGSTRAPSVDSLGDSLENLALAADTHILPLRRRTISGTVPGPMCMT